MVGKLQDAPFHVDRWHSDEVGEAARIEARAAEHLAHRFPPGQAVAAYHAGHVVGSDDAIANLDLLNPVAHGHHASRHLMAQDGGSLWLTIPLQDVAPADPAGGDFEQQLTSTDRRERTRLQPKVAIGMVDGDPILGRQAHVP